MKKTESQLSFSRDDFFTVDELATYLRVAKSTIYSWCHQRKITFYKHFRRTYFLKEEIQKFVFNDQNLCKSKKHLAAEVFRESLQQRGKK